jgi:trehalose 2-sulfotransferase
VNYIICSSPRCGSTLLAQTLLSMGVGNPGEFLNPSLINEPEHGGPDKFMKPTPVAYVEQLKQVQTINGVFGLKTHYADLARQPEIFNNMATLFPDAKYISITRRNVLRQALSAARAAQTMAWTSSLRDQRQPRFHYFAVIKHVIHTLREVECWERFYTARNIKPLRILYEELDEDYVNTMQKVVSFLGVTASIPTAPIKKQANAKSDEWADRFIETFRGKSAFSTATRLITRRW